MKTTILRTMAFGFLLAGGGYAHADSPYRDIVAGDASKTLDETWALAADGSTTIANISGKVQVTGWDQAQVKLEGSLGAGSTLAVSGDAKKLSLQVKTTKTGWFGSNAPSHDSNLILHVPKNTALDLSVVSADANVDGMDGKSLKVGSVSGDVAFAGSAPQIDIDSVSGNVTLATPAGANGRAHVQTVSGDISAKNLGGRIKLETVSGNMDCACATVNEFESGSVSGDADIAVAPANDARLHLSTMSGSVTLHLPATLSARIDASSFSGGIRSDFGTVQTKEYGPGSSLKATLGAGSAQIGVESMSGDIRLHKQ